MFASYSDLGYDPSIEQVIEHEKIEYNVRCGGKWYRVLEALQDTKAAYVLGPGTRVWKVQELKDRLVDSTLVGDILVMKDMWSDKHAPSEKDILDDIIARVNTVHDIGSVESDFATRYFLGIREDERVQIADHERLREDCSSAILRNYVVASDNALTVSPNQEISDFKGYTAKQHRRILYVEYAHPLDAPDILTDHQLFFTSLRQVTRGISSLLIILSSFNLGRIGLELLYSAGYVHRDLSPGNLLSCSDGNCKISDFEYAKPYEHPDGRIGNGDVKVASLILFPTLNSAHSLVGTGNTGFHGY